VLVDTADTSTISSRAVSGSITTVNISPAEIVTPPSKEVPDTTVAVVPDDVNAPDNVVCCEREEYLRVVIYLPIGCSGRGLDTGFAVFEFPH
jgi:hypothetical protein